MVHVLDDSEAHDDDGIDSLRARVHRMSDLVHAHDGMLREHSVLLSMNGKQIEVVRTSCATVEQLNHASATMKTAVENSERLLTEKLTTLSNDLGPIKRGVYWAIAIILGAVLMALMALVLNGPPPKILP